MVRLIVIGIAIVLVVWLLKRAIAGPRKPSSAEQEKGKLEGELVSCAHCKVNLPRSEARSAGGHYFCSEEHWRLGPRDG